MQHNSKAISVYRKLGFEVTREFNCLIQDSKAICSLVQSFDLPYSIKSIRVEEYDAISGFWKFQPFWQNSLEAIKRVPDHFVSLGIFIADQLVGYIVFEPSPEILPK